LNQKITELQDFKHDFAAKSEYLYS